MSKRTTQWRKTLLQRTQHEGETNAKKHKGRVQTLRGVSQQDKQQIITNCSHHAGEPMKAAKITRIAALLSK